MAFAGNFSAGGKYLAYSPVGGGAAFNYSAYVAWKNYRGGLASSVWIADMATLDVVKVPKERSNDYSPMWVDKNVYFLSDRNGATTLFRFEPATKSVTEVVKNDGADIRSASAGPGGIVYDRLGELFLYDTASGKTNQISVDVSADLPDVRSRISPVDRDIQSYGVSPTGVRAVFEAHGDILTVPAKESTTRDITNTPGVMERDPAWSPDGQSIAYFSDESGQYALHISSQSGAGEVKKFPLANDATFYFQPAWSPDSKLIAFHDNKTEIWLLDTVTAKATVIGKAVVDDGDYSAAWSPDSKWLAYTQTVANRFHALFLFSVESGKSTQVTDGMSDVRFPAFDRSGKYLYFTESTNYGTTSSGLDMSSDAFNVTRSVYGLALASDTASPIAVQGEDEKKPDAKDKKEGDTAGDKSSDKGASDAAKKPDEAGKPEKTEKVKPVKIDLEHLEDRAVALPLPAANYAALTAGKEGTLYLLEGGGRFAIGRGLTLTRFELKTKKTEKLAEHVAGFDLSFDGNKMLLEMAGGDGAPAAGGAGAPRCIMS